jgi:multidrug resistance efflux pump
MDNSILYKTQSIRFIKIIFIFSVTLLALIFMLFFLLRMNDTVSFKEGLIYSDNPQFKVITPNEVRILAINVKEGQEIKKGDTLFVLENLRTKTDYDVANLDIATMQSKINYIAKMQSSAMEKRAAMQQLVNIQQNIYKTDRKKSMQQIATLNSKIALSSQQTDILNEKYKTDSILYAKGAISKFELTEQRARKIDDRKIQADIQEYFKQGNFDYENLTNNYLKTKNELKRGIIEIDNQIVNYKAQIDELAAQIKNRKYNLNYLSDEMQKLMVTATIDGTISNIFNSLQRLELVNKGELLAIIAPKKENFYAKITLPEKDLTYVKRGQDVNLKIDAYNYYKFGVIRGKITYVSPSDVARKYSCLVKLTKYNRNINLKAGYTLKGEIIIEEMKLYEYILKQLFNKADNALDPDQPAETETPKTT